MSAATRFIAPGALGGLAALVGGAAGHARRCQSCLPILVVLALAAAPPAGAESGGTAPALLDTSLHDIVDEAPTFRVRYVAPGLADPAVSYTDAADEMQRLCDEDALPRLVEKGAAPGRIVVTLMAEPVEFGAISPGIRQFFESYSVRDGLCIWEAF